MTYLEYSDSQKMVTGSSSIFLRVRAGFGTSGKVKLAQKLERETVGKFAAFRGMKDTLKMKRLLRRPERSSQTNRPN
jgi:hypothetical protein